MSRKFRRRRAGIVAVAAALASLGAVDATVLASGRGSAPELASAVAAQSTPAASSQGLASPPQTDSAAVPSAPASTAPVQPKVTAKPPPVVDGVTRTNVGLAHSPQVQQQLSAPVTTPPPADAGALGIDVADYQHRHGAIIDWSQVAAAGYKFAFIKATEGDYYANPYYASDLAQAKAAGLYATGYHFAIPNVSDGASQADYAVANGDYAPDGHTLPMALDIEYNPYGSECYGMSPAQMVSWLSAFAAEVQRITGQRAIIYTTADWWDTCTGDSTAFGSDSLWVAAYRSGTPPMPAGWGNWTFWQYTSRGSIPGITGNVDVSYFLQAALRLLDPSSQQSAAGTALQLQVTSLNAADGQSPQFAAAGLPPGLSISSSGLITGTIAASAAGTYQVTVTATSSSGATGSVSFLWTVSPPGQPSGSQQPSSPSQPSPPETQQPSPPPSFLLTPPDSPPPTDAAPPTDSPPPSDPASPADPASASPSPTDTPSPSDPASPTPSDSPSPSATPSPTTSACASPTGSVPPPGSPSPSVTPSPSPAGSACTSPSNSVPPADSASASPPGPATPSALSRRARDHPRVRLALRLAVGGEAARSHNRGAWTVH